MTRKLIPPEPSEHVQVVVEAWLTRSGQVLRFYAMRPNSAKVAYKEGELRVAIQPVEKGMVAAWKPLWSGWAFRQETFPRLQELLDQGWLLDTTHVQILDEFQAWQAAQPLRLVVASGTSAHEPLVAIVTPLFPGIEDVG